MFQILPVGWQKHLTDFHPGRSEDAIKTVVLYDT